MADFTNSANMSLPVPTVGIAPGPEWATLLDNCLTIIDGHTHTPGSGVPITSAALNINADLSMIGNNLTNIRTLRLAPQSAVAGPSDIGVLYEIGNDLYYTDGTGAQIRITQAGSVTGSSGTITGLPSGTASAVYDSIGGAFIFQSATNIAANIGGGSFLFRNTSPNSTNAVTLQASPSLAANYALTLPLLPTSQKFMTLDNNGIMSAPWAVDGTTIEVNGGTTVQVKNQGITQIKLAPRAIGTTVAAGGVAISGSSGTGPGCIASSSTPTAITNLSVTITTTGRPVQLALNYDGVTAQSNTGISLSGAGGEINVLGWISITENGSTININKLNINAASNGSNALGLPLGSVNYLRVTPAGTYTYQVLAYIFTPNYDLLQISGAVLVAYEI